MKKMPRPNRATPTISKTMNLTGALSKSRAISARKTPSSANAVLYMSFSSKLYPRLPLENR